MLACVRVCVCVCARVRASRLGLRHKEGWGANLGAWQEQERASTKEKERASTKEKERASTKEQGRSPVQSVRRRKRDGERAVSKWERRRRRAGKQAERLGSCNDSPRRISAHSAQ
eukprot:2167540-Pleurochrysis_carterae.AAC.3